MFVDRGYVVNVEETEWMSHQESLLSLLSSIYKRRELDLDVVTRKNSVQGASRNENHIKF